MGQRIRCEIVTSLIHEPKILFLDEPTIGLDPVVKENIRVLIRRMNKEFKITIFSICGGLIITSVSVILNSLSFWFQKSDMIAQTGNDIMIHFATYPDDIFKGITKLLLYTIIPVGLSTYIPVKALMEFNIYLVLPIPLVAIFFILLAFKIFYFGLKKYSSSSLMIVRI